MSECDLDTSVPDWVIEHPESLSVFQELGIDTCCGGKSLGFVCRQHGLDEETVLVELVRRVDASRQDDRRAGEEHLAPCKSTYRTGASQT